MTEEEGVELAMWGDPSRARDGLFTHYHECPTCRTAADVSISRQRWASMEAGACPIGRGLMLAGWAFDTEEGRERWR